MATPPSAPILLLLASQRRQAAASVDGDPALSGTVGHAGIAPPTVGSAFAPDAVGASKIALEPLHASSKSEFSRSFKQFNVTLLRQED